MGGATLWAADKPNIVILYADDMGYGQPSCYGGKLAPTPNIDSLAAQGVLFTQGYASGCVCSPSRVGLLTGRYQARTGQDNLISEAPSRFLLKSEVLLPELLKQAGYATGIFGKWHLGHTEGYRPIDRGFDEFFGPYTNKGEVEHYYRNTEIIPKPAVDSPALAAEAVRFITAHRDEPFFVYLPFTAVHAPIEASPAWLETFSEIKNPNQRVYAAMCAELDAAIGTVMNALREHGLEENTLVIFTSDNGGAAFFAENGPFRGAKWSLLEGGIHEPFIIQWKARVAPGRTLDIPVSQLDLFPTALAAANVAAPASLAIDGVSLLPLLANGKTTLPRDTLFWRYGAQFAIRQGDWKLVKSEQDEPVALYNLAADPGETSDLSGAEPERTKAMLVRWEQWNATMQPPRWEDPRSGGLRNRQQFEQNRKRRDTTKAAD